MVTSKITDIQNNDKVGKAILNKRGSYVIFLTLAFSAILILLITAIRVSRERAVESTAEAFGQLWGTSIIAEYDRVLNERYGLYGFYGDEYTVEQKLDYYAEYTANDKEYVNYGGSSVNLDPYSLANLNIFSTQVNEACYEKPRKGESETAISGIEEGKKENRYISARWIINSLPSGGKSTNISISKVLSGKGESYTGIGNSILEELYLFNHFKDYVNDREIGETYFNNEVEYILTGKLDDEKARKGVYNALLGVRESMNLTYLYGCQEKSDAALAIGMLISPPLAAAIQAAILAAWALGESINDIKLLYDNKGVPMLKTDDTFALSIGNIVSVFWNEEEEKYEYSLHTPSEKGGYVSPPTESELLKYDDYLKLFLATVSNETVLLRMMDLIQINMKYSYCGYFLLCDYYTGLDYTLKVNNKEYEFSEKY